MRILPSIDLKDGKVVRLYKGDFATTHTVADSAEETARRFLDAGAALLHMVDLDGAKTGGGANRRLVRDVIAHTGAAVELVGLERREYMLKDALSPLRSQYDDIFIDCPPSLELLTLNALCAADSILIPVQCEYYALEGLSDLMMTLRAVKRQLNPGLEIFGVLLTMFDGRTNFSAQVAEEVRRHFPGKVFAAVIPRNVRLSEAPSHGLPVFAYDRFSRGAAAYQKLAEEILKKRPG